MDAYYLGRKIIKATPMSRLEYNIYRGWTMPEDEDDIPGYLVEYPGSDHKNHPDHEGYISWSPADAFTPTHLHLGDIGQYPDFLQRLIAEQVELDDRLIKLTTYLENPDSAKNKQRSLLQLQLAHMRGLNSVLQARITELKKEYDREQGDVS